MKYNYNKLWRLCVEKEISPSKLFSELGISSQGLFKMRHNENVALSTIDRLCQYFKCQPCDIVELENDHD